MKLAWGTSRHAPASQRHQARPAVLGLLATFALASLSGALAAGAVGALTPSLLLYPVYYCLVNGAIAVLILHRRSLLAGLQPASSPARTFP
jgi:hypothetical protein